ncbi:MAG: Plug domain-containing protein [Nitrospiraceae bacterium]
MISFPILHGVIVFSLLFPLFTRAASLEAPAHNQSAKAGTLERVERIEDLKRQRDRIQQELSELHRQPEGVGAAIIPRSEFRDQPTRTLRESLESAPGATVRQGASSRDLNLSIRGAGQ